jgi:hypothetical protein
MDVDGRPRPTGALKIAAEADAERKAETYIAVVEAAFWAYDV